MIRDLITRGFGNGWGLVRKIITLGLGSDSATGQPVATISQPSRSQVFTQTQRSTAIAQQQREQTFWEVR